MKEKFIVTMIATSSNYLITLITFYFLFLKLNVELLGIYTFINSIVHLGFITIDLGLTNIHYRFSSKKNYNHYFSTYLFIKLILLLICITFSVILITIIQLWTSPYLFYIFMYLFSMTILALINLLITNLKSMKKILISEITFFFYILSKHISILFLIFNLSNISNPLLYIFSSNLIFELMYIGILIWFSKSFLLKLTKPKKKIIFIYFRETKYVSLRALLYICVSNIGNLLLNFSFGYELLGFFSLVYQIIFFFNTISVSLIPIYISFFSEYFEKNDLSSIIEITHKVEKYSSILFISIIAITYLNGSLIFSIFLPKYLSSIPVLFIMIFNPYFLGITRPYENQLIPGKKENTFAFAGIFTYILQIFLMFLLIPKQILIFNMMGLGMVGFGLALTIPWGVYAIICHYFSNKYFNIKSQKVIFIHILLALIALLIVFILKINVLNFIFTNQIILLLSSTLILIALFFTELFLFKQLKKEDIIFLLELFQFKRYKDSIKKELLLD